LQHQPTAVWRRRSGGSTVHTNADKLNDYEIDNNDGIIAVGDIPHQPPHAPLLVDDTGDNNNTTAGSGDDDDEDNEDVDGEKDDDNLSEQDDKPEAATNALDGSKSDSDQGV
jgi:hypothetical protein